MSTGIALTVGGQKFTGFKSVRVSCGIEQFAGAFEMECADRWAIKGQTTPLLEGEPCSVQIYGQTVITGFIDASNPRYGRDEHALNVTGRDAAGDLVDCAAVSDGFGVLNRTLPQIAQDLCAPFGIGVSVAPGVDAGPAFQYQRINVGETVFEALSRLAQIRGVLIVSDGQGGIQITQAGTVRATTRLQLGVNIKAGEAIHSVQQRFREYLVYGQTFELDNPAAAQQVLGRATDSYAAIRSARKTIVDPVEPSDIYMATKLAQWVANTRRAQGERATFTVKGWLDGAAPWKHNTVVAIDCPWTRFQGDFLICGVRFELDKEEGEVTHLSVVPRDAYSLIAHQESPDLIYGLLALPPDAGE